MLRSTDLRDEHKRLTGEHLSIMEAANNAARDLTRDERSRLFAIERRLTALLDVIADTETAEPSKPLSLLSHYAHVHRCHSSSRNDLSIGMFSNREHTERSEGCPGSGSKRQGMRH